MSGYCGDARRNVPLEKMFCNRFRFKQQTPSPSGGIHEMQRSQDEAVHFSPDKDLEPHSHVAVTPLMLFDGMKKALLERCALSIETLSAASRGEETGSVWRPRTCWCFSCLPAGSHPARPGPALPSPNLADDLMRTLLASYHRIPLDS